jgi:hypothetical protein
MLPHKEGTNPPVRKIIIGVPKYLGAEVQVEFTMPDSSEVAETCGVALAQEVAHAGVVRRGNSKNIFVADY